LNRSIELELNMTNCFIVNFNEQCTRPMHLEQLVTCIPILALVVGY